MIINLAVEDKRRKRSLRDLAYLVFHHTATPADMPPSKIVYRSGNEVFLSPYHYLVYLDGRIFKTRNISERGICVAGLNMKTVCVAGVGNWENSDITTEAFLDSISLLSYNLVKYYKLEIKLHRDLIPTACPGRFFPLKRILERMKENEKKNLDLPSL